MRITLVSLFSFLLRCCCMHITVASANFLEDQQSLLLQLKKNLTFQIENKGKLEQWNQSIAYCNWNGVTCDNQGQVIDLDLSKESISSGFDNSSSLLSLQKLTKIRILCLYGISLTTQGHEWSNILLSLLDLQELSMSRCGLSGPLDSSLSKLENLSIIILDGNNFSSPVPESFANFKNLITFSLSNCGLTGTFSQKIFQIGTLSVIDLSMNYNLHGSFPDYSISESLDCIRVSYTNFSGALPNSIGNVRRLSILDLSYSQFNGELPNSLPNLTQLKYLDLSSNCFTGPMPSFDLAKRCANPSSAHNEGWKNLAIINLRNNSIKGSIPSFLFTLPSL